MKRLSSQHRGFVCLVALIACSSRSWAGPCESIALPDEIKRSLEKEFVGWKVVVPELLSSPDDRQIWNADYGSECPGIISGHFRGHRVEYAVSLVRGSGETLEQQFVFFGIGRTGFKKMVLIPALRGGVVNVLRKWPPGVYRDQETGRTVRIAFDTIGVSQIEAGAIAFYWDGRRFRTIVTSI